MMNEGDILNLVDEFLLAWARADTEKLLNLMHDDCIYSASVGPEPGNTIKGKQEIRKHLLPIVESELDGQQGVGQKWVIDDIVFVEWSYEKKLESGTLGVVRGVDIIRAVANKIISIDAYRKASR